MTAGRPTNQPFNLVAFADAVAARIAYRGISDRQASREIGVSPSTVSRLMLGHNIDLNVAASVAIWADLDLDAFISRPKRTTDGAS